MTIANKLKHYLEQAGADYQLKAHSPSHSSMETAELAHVPGDALAKGILLSRAGGLLLVVLPSDYHIELPALQDLLDQPVEMVSEAVVASTFNDCEGGAVPPLGAAYGIDTIWDPNTSLGRLDQIFFEAGDHRNLVCVSGEQFHELMASAERGEFSSHI